MQRGKGLIEGNEVIITDEEGNEIVLPINTPSDSIPETYEEEKLAIGKKEIKLNRELMIKIKGKSYPTIDAVVDAMYRADVLKEWRVELLKCPAKVLPEKRGNKDPEDINSDAYLAVVKATVKLSDGNIFESIGDAHPLSVSDSMRPHVIRMAETRALARALRFAGNISGSMAEELKIDME